MKKTSITIIFSLVLVCHLYSETKWNPSILETQKVAILNAMEKERAFLQTIRPINTQLSVRRDNAFPPVKQICDVSVVGHTNIIAFRPFQSQAFDLHLFDANGNAIHKTFFGWMNYGNSLKVDDELLDPRHHIIMNWLRDERTMNFNAPSWGNTCWRFDVLKCFSIREPGEYRLQVQVRLFTKDTNGNFQPLVLLPVETKLTIEDADLNCLSERNFNLLISLFVVIAFLAVWRVKVSRNRKIST